MIALYIFLFYFILISSIIQCFSVNQFSIFSIIYFCKLIIYIEIYFYFKKLKFEQGIKILLKGYIAFSILSLFIFLYFFYKKIPNAEEILWHYEVGNRLIPIFGLNLRLEYPFFSIANGGSGNLIGTYSSFILLFCMNMKCKNLYKFIISMYILIISFLSVSRGTIISIIIIFIYSFFYKIKISKLKKIMIGLFIICSIIYFLNETYIGQMILRRLVETINVKNNTLDASSRGRLANYKDFFEVWISQLKYILFGMGFDRNILKIYTGRGFVESFIMQLVFSSGILGVILFCIFIYRIFKLKNNIFEKSLKEYLIINIFFNWLIVGGDFTGPVNMFILNAVLGLIDSRENCGDDRSIYM